eukprot:Awhi_evm1s7793
MGFSHAVAIAQAIMEEIFWRENILYERGYQYIFQGAAFVYLDDGFAMGYNERRVDWLKRCM